MNQLPSLFASGDVLGLAADMAKFAMGCSTLLGIAFLVLLALPRSQLRAASLEAVSWASMAFSGLYVLSPFDVIPDVIPIVGWLDDAGALAYGGFSFVTALRQRGERKQLLLEAEAGRTEGQV